MIQFIFDLPKRAHEGSAWESRKGRNLACGACIPRAEKKFAKNCIVCCKLSICLNLLLRQTLGL